MNSDFWIILTGCLVAIPCAILGSFLVLKKMVMVGDAISHAVLPGIVIAYIFTKSVDSPFMLVFASLFGLLTTFLIELFHKKAGLQEDASIGVVFTWMFAGGIIMISIFARQADLDQDCVLYGEIIQVPFNLWITEAGTNMGPSPVWMLGSINLLVLAFVVFGYKELKITTFDTGFAQIIGISTAFWHYALMGSVSVVTVSSFEAVGAILVVAFLVIPAATAYLITHSLQQMLFLAVFFSIVSVVAGYYISGVYNLSTSAMMAVCAGGLFFIVFLLRNLRSKKVDLSSVEHTTA